VSSPWILHYNSGACNGCDIELVGCPPRPEAIIDGVVKLLKTLQGPAKPKA
jgi:Ni,Fe-hydrogenase III small subunit